MPSPANLLTDFILRQSYADLPEPIRHQAKRCLLDSMGALSAGAVTPLARLTARTAERFFQGGGMHPDLQRQEGLPPGGQHGQRFRLQCP